MLELLLTFMPSPAIETWDLMAREVGSSVAHVTLVAGPPDGFADMPDGSRAFYCQDQALAPRGGALCTFTLYATSNGQPSILAAWKVVAIEPPTPGCG